MNDLDRAEIYALIRNIYRCQSQAYRDADKSLATGTWVAVDLNQTRYDHVPHRQAAMHDNAVNNSRIYARIAGVYSYTAQASFNNHATGDRRLAVCVNAAGAWSIGATVGIINQISPGAALRADLALAGTVYLNIGDYIEMFVRQESGGALNLVAYRFAPILSLAYLGE